MTSIAPIITDDLIQDFQRDGAVCIRGAMSDWVDTIAAGIDHNMAEPSEAADGNVGEGAGQFFDDYCNWQRIDAFKRAAIESPAADIAGQLMRSVGVQLFHDHVLVKEPGTTKPTPWHCDSPYYFVDGTQTVSLWIPVDPVGAETTLQVIAGSHRWDEAVLPVSWNDDSAFYDGTAAGDGTYRAAPEPLEDSLLSWPLDPGDLVAFDYRAVHGAKGNLASTRRRVLSLRYVGDDARFVQRPGRTSPPFPGHGMVDGDQLRSDWFPHVRG